MNIPDLPFHEMNPNRFPYWMGDQNKNASIRCEARWRQEGFEQPFDERLAVKHHVLTIKLALGDFYAF